MKRWALALGLVLVAGATVAWILWTRSSGRRSTTGPSTTTLVVRISDAATGEPLAARVQLLTGPDAPLHIGRLDMYGNRQGAKACALAPDVVGSWDGLIVGRGLAEIPIGADRCDPSPAIPYGRYQVIAYRGIEYEMWTGTVDLSARRGRVEIAIPLERAWSAKGSLSADLHVHAAASPDSTVPNLQRVVAQVAAGIQVIGLSDHDRNGDLDAEIEELGLGDIVASIASNEVTGAGIHVGVYPVVVDRTRPNNGAIPEPELSSLDDAGLFRRLRALPGRPVVQLNHPRLRSTALYDQKSWDGVTWPPPFSLDFDAVEVLAGYTSFNEGPDRRIDDSVRDFFTLIDRGVLVAPLGNSDTHSLNWNHDGTTRTYVRVALPRVKPFDEAAFVDAIRERRVVATTGPWLDVAVSGTDATVGPGEMVAASGRVKIAIDLAQARFVSTEVLRVIAGRPSGPTLVETIDVPAGARAFHWDGEVEVGDVDTWIAVTASGETPLPLVVTGTYHKEKGRRGVAPFAITSPILIDVDDDEEWTRPRLTGYLGTPRGSSTHILPGAPIRPPRSSAPLSSPQ